jgi:threonine dehydrogenase-like Zn-dependent dehydrogenase
VRYPFHPGYSFVGVDEHGSRVCAHAPHSQRAVVGKQDVIPVPEGISDEQASWFALASIAQLAVVAAELRQGDAVVVVGAGVIGQLVAQLARLAGAGRVVVVARARPRLEAALRHGASEVVAADAAGARDRVLELTGGEGAAAVFEVTGSEPVFAEALKLARRHGTVVLVGDAGHPREQRLGPELLLNGLRVVGAHFDHASRGDRQRLAADFFEAVRAGQLVVDDLATQRLDPRDAPAFYRSLSDPDPARLGVLFDWSLV